MAPTDNTEVLYAEVPRGLKRLAKEDDRTVKEVVTQALERELGVASEDSVAVFDRKIRRTEQALSEAQERHRGARDEVETLKTRLEDYREIRDDKAAAQDDYEDLLDDLLDDMVAEGTDVYNVPAYHPRIDDIAECVDRQADEIHLDLQRRAAEQARDLAHTEFMDKRRGDQIASRPIAEEWGDADDEEDADDAE